MAIIYKATCKITGKSYIGYTTMSLRQRFKDCGKRAHLVRAFDLKEKSKFYNALRKYGWNNFKVSILEKMPLEKAKVKEDNGKTYISNREIYWISVYNSYYDGYNMTLGGDGIFGLKMSEETKKKISNANKKFDHSYMKRQDVRKACSDGRKGKILVNKDNVMKFIKIEDLDNYLKEGYQRGRSSYCKGYSILYSKEAIEKRKDYLIGSKFLYKDNVRKKFKKSELSRAYLEGWKTLKDYRMLGNDIPDYVKRSFQLTVQKSLQTKKEKGIVQC